MSAEPFTVTPGSRGRALNVLGHFITVLVSGESTEGYEIFLIEGPDGSGPRAHCHPWDEALYVTRGSVEVGLGKETLIAPPGTLVHLPAGSPHGFRFGKGGGEMVCITSRLGASRIFIEIDREMAPEQPNRERLAEIARRHGMTAAD